MATALPTNAARAHVAGRVPRTAKPYSASRTATAARPYCVTPKMRPTAHELKNGPGIKRDRREEQAGEEPEQIGPPRARPGQAAHHCARQGGRGQQHDGQHDKVAGGKWSCPEDVTNSRREPQLAPVIPGLGREPRELGEPGRREVRLDSAPGKVSARIE